MALIDVPINISGLPDAPLPLSGSELVPADRTLGGQTVKMTTSVIAAYVAISGTPGIVTSVGTGTGLIGGPITTAGTISLADTAVVPGTYVRPTITIDQQGRITFAAPGGAIGTISSISSSTLSLAPSNPLTSDGSIDLVSTSVTPGSYTVPNITVDQYGRIIFAASGAAVTQINTGTGLTGGPITTVGTISLADTAVTPGTYTLATITVDQQGRLTAASTGSSPGTGTVTNVATGTGLTGGPITTTGTISLANTAVTPGSYTLASITVDAQGRLTAASNGSAPGSGTVTSVATGTGLTGGPITTTGTIVLADTAVTPGTYTLMTGTVDQQGRLTAASGGSAVTSITAGTGLSGGTITGVGTIDIAATGVTATSYTLMNATVNAQGQITTASNGSAVTSITAGSGLTGGTITSTGTITIANTAVTPGSYTAANITVGADGRLTAAANGGGAGVTSITASTGITLTPNPIITTGTIAISNTAVTPGTYTNTTLTVNAQGQLTAASSGTQRVSVVDAYGWVGDGTTDNTAAAVTALTSGKALFVPPGNYKIATNVVYGSADVDIECSDQARFFCNKSTNFTFKPTWGPIETATAITEGTQCTNGGAFATSVGGGGYVVGDILELPAERMTLKHYKLAPRWQVTTLSGSAAATITCIQPGVILGVFSSTIVNALTLRSVTGSGSGAQLGSNVTWSTAPSNGQNLVTQLSLVNVGGNLSADAVTITFDDASTISVGDCIKVFSADQKMAVVYTTTMTITVSTALIDGVRPRIVSGGTGYTVGNTITIARATTTPVAYGAQVQPIQAGFSPTDCIITVDAVTSVGAITQCHVTNAGSYRYVNYDVVGQGSTSGGGTGFTCYLTYDAGTNLVGFAEMAKVVRCVDKNTIWLQRILRLPHVQDGSNPILVRKVPTTALHWSGGRFVGDPAVGSIHSLAVTGRVPAIFFNEGSTRIRMIGMIDEGVFERFIDDQSGYGARYEFQMEDSVFLRAQSGFGYGIFLEASCMCDVSVIAHGGTFGLETGAESTSYSSVSTAPQAIGPAMDCVFHDSVARGAAFASHPATMFSTWNNCTQIQATPDWQGTVQGDSLQRGFVNQGYMCTFNNCRATGANWAFEDRSQIVGYFGLMGAPNITSYKNCSAEWSDIGGTGASGLLAAFRVSNVSSVGSAWGLMDTRGMTTIEGCRANRCGYFADITEGSPRVLIRGGTAIDCDRFVNFQTMGRLTVTDSVYDCSTLYHIPQVASSTLVHPASSNITGNVDLILDGMRCIYQAGGQATAVIDQQDTNTLNAMNLWLGDIFIPLNFDQTLLHNGGGGLNIFDMKVDAFRGKNRVLAVSTGVNLNAIGDTTMVLPTNITRYLILGCYITNCTTSLTTARSSVWSGAGGTGSNFAADQALSGLTGTATQLYQLTMTALAGTQTQSGPQVYFRVGTAQGSAATGDVYVVGIDLSVG